jgi:hypothetical protein
MGWPDLPLRWRLGDNGDDFVGLIRADSVRLESRHRAAVYDRDHDPP